MLEDNTMAICLIAVLYKDTLLKNIAGFRFMDSDTCQITDQPYDKVLGVARSQPGLLRGIEYDPVKKELKGSNGAFDRYSAIIGNRIIKQTITVLNTVNGKHYHITNAVGKHDIVSDINLIELASKVGIANGKLVTKNGETFVSAISGNYDDKTNNDIVLPEAKVYNKAKEEAKEYAEELKKDTPNTATLHRDHYLPKVVSCKSVKNSRLKETDPVTGMLIEDKLAATVFALKNTRPFCYSLYCVLNVVEADPNEIDTMGVTLDTLLFNSEFVKELTLPELYFIICHELYHISMRHRARSKGRNHSLWNIACDLYINKCIAEEHGLSYDKPLNRIDNTNFKIALPSMGLFNPKVSVKKDTPESIYDELLEDYNQNQNQQNNQSSNSSNGDGQSSSGNSQSSSGEGQTQSSDDSIGSGNQGSQSSDNESNSKKGQGNSSGSGSQSKSGQKNDKSQNGDGNDTSDEKSDNADETDSSAGNGKGNGSKKDKVTFRGQEIAVDFNKQDIVDDVNSQGSSQDVLDQKSKSMLRKAITMHKQSGNSFGGDAGSFIERMVELELAPKINWRALLRNKLVRATQKVNTFAAPDKRFRSRNMIMPGPKALENDALDGVKVCIDTSGSISDQDIGIALAQIKQLLKTYKAKAELLYWDTDVRATYDFTDIKDIIKKKPAGGGGTDANCIFNYFETNKDYKIGRKDKPSVVVVFTDGYFGQIDPKYRKYRDTIWVINGDINFTAPFGVLAPFKPED